MKKARRRDCAGADRKPQSYCNLGTSASSKRIQRSLQKRLVVKTLILTILSDRIMQRPHVLQALFLRPGLPKRSQCRFQECIPVTYRGFEQAGNKQAPGPKGVTAEWPLNRGSLAIKQLADGYVML